MIVLTKEIIITRNYKTKDTATQYYNFNILQVNSKLKHWKTTVLKLSSTMNNNLDEELKWFYNIDDETTHEWSLSNLQLKIGNACIIRLTSTKRSEQITTYGAEK